ncbi:MAG: phosphatase PAP2 family protein [Fibrobacter sp.]|nr:phosphatase PAP2 family protein [Fibrobacter sp.]
MLKKIAKFDEKFSRYLYTHRLSSNADSWLRRYTRLGDGYVWALIAILIGIVDGPLFLAKVLAQVAPSLVAALALYWIVKLTSKRRRPFEAIPEFKALVPPLDKYSFPSGHTMNNLAIATTVLLAVPVAGAVMIALPLTWGFLRVYFGVHWLSDVIGGFLLGILSFAIGHVVWIFAILPLVAGFFQG